MKVQVKRQIEGEAREVRNLLAGLCFRVKIPLTQSDKEEPAYYELPWDEAVAVLGEHRPTALKRIRDMFPGAEHLQPQPSILLYSADCEVVEE